MPVKVSKKGGRYRVVDANTGRLTKGSGGGSADGGGHATRAKATKQAQAINISQARSEGKKIPQRRKRR